MAVNEPYNAYNDLYEIYDLLKKYDIVFTCDSDIFITDINKPVSDFADKYLNLGRENWCPTQYSICNGGFLIFYRKDDGIFSWLEKLISLQEQCKKIKESSKYVYVKFANDDTTTYIVRLSPEYGTQSVLSYIYLSNSELMHDINLISTGILQSYIPELTYYGKNMYEFAKWNKQKFLVHLISLISNHPTIKTKADAMKAFLAKYPEYA